MFSSMLDRKEEDRVLRSELKEDDLESDGRWSSLSRLDSISVSMGHGVMASSSV